ncbi:MAG: hypothetical protein IKE60_21360 [Reyranella sp.]|uniref:hypothetical protein n=1 Tax=Reyranella sp. TaxID=1929291 RepID=UPI0025DAE0FD|nr:hypothetical protein [Reyranella sp.]MBR2817221.1 hypothetical protein [Reyranella sp.]
MSDTPPTVVDLLLAMQTARAHGERLATVLRNLEVVAGQVGWSTPYVIARAWRSGVFEGRIRWQIEGRGSDALAVTARATLAHTGEDVAAQASLALARAEGWTRNARYVALPEQMLRHRSATMLIRLYCPEVLAGLPTADELEDLSVAGLSPDAAPDDAADDSRSALLPTTAEIVSAILMSAAGSED